MGEADPCVVLRRDARDRPRRFAKLAPHLPRDPFDLEAAEARFAQSRRNTPRPARRSRRLLH